MSYENIAMLKRLDNMRASPTNLLANLLGVASSFDTAPTDLLNITDGDPATYSGEGSKASGNGGFGYIEYDLGSIKKAIYSGSLKLWADSAVAMTIYIQWKNASGDTYVQQGQNCVSFTCGTSEPAGPTQFNFNHVITGRYIRFVFSTASVNNPKTKINEFSGHELKMTATG